MICVFDSSVWISGFEFGGAPLRAVDFAFRRHQVAICEPIVQEVRATLDKKFNWPLARIDRVLSIYLADAMKAKIRGKLCGVCRDSKDDMVLECATEADASIIVTGDKDLLALGEYEAIRIVTPRQFLDEFATPPHR